MLISRKRGVLWLLIPVLAVAAGCGDDKSTDPGDENPSAIAFPLKEGNQWTYAVTQSGAVAKDSSYVRTDRIQGTGTFDQKSYFLLVSDEQGDSVYVRQEGQQIWGRPVFHLPNPEQDSVGYFLADKMIKSLPWRVMDFAARGNTSWDLLNVSKTWTEQGANITLNLRIAAGSLGRASVTVPSGAYSDVYKGTFTRTQTVTINISPIGPITLAATSTQTFYVKTAIGIVKEEDVEHEDRPEGEPYDRTTRAELQSYQLIP